VSAEKRVSVLFRCSDEAYARIFRRQDGRDGIHSGRGQRMDEVITRFCDALEEDKEAGIRLTHPKCVDVRVRRVWIDPKVKARFDRLARNAPVSNDVLMREAIFRFTGAC
jgi:hypothetical protein